MERRPQRNFDRNRKLDDQDHDRERNYGYGYERNNNNGRGYDRNPEQNWGGRGQGRGFRGRGQGRGQGQGQRQDRDWDRSGRGGEGGRGRGRGNNNMDRDNRFKSYRQQQQPLLSSRYSGVSNHEDRRLQGQFSPIRDRPFRRDNGMLNDNNNNNNNNYNYNNRNPRRGNFGNFNDNRGLRRGNFERFNDNRDSPINRRGRPSGVSLENSNSGRFERRGPIRNQNREDFGKNRGNFRDDRRERDFDAPRNRPRQENFPNRFSNDRPFNGGDVRQRGPNENRGYPRSRGNNRNIGSGRGGRIIQHNNEFRTGRNGLNESQNRNELGDNMTGIRRGINQEAQARRSYNYYDNRGNDIRNSANRPLGQKRQERPRDHEQNQQQSDEYMDLVDWDQPAESL